MCCCTGCAWGCAYHVVSCHLSYISVCASLYCGPVPNGSAHLVLILSQSHRAQGAYRGMIERWGLSRLRNCRFGGNSAGTLVAVAAATGRGWEYLENIYHDLARKASQDGVVGKMTKCTCRSGRTLASRWANANPARLMASAASHVLSSVCCMCLLSFSHGRAL